MAKKPIYNVEGEVNEETPPTKKAPVAKAGKKIPPKAPGRNPFGGKKK